MKTIRFLIIALLTTLICSQVQAQGSQTFNVPLTEPGKSASLKIGLVNGSINIIGEQRQDLKFEATARSSQQRIITPSGSMPITNASFELDVVEDNNTIRVDSDSYRNPIDIVVHVPVNMDLELSTVNSGKITVNNVNGHQVFDNVNGPVTATKLKGTVLAETVNGDITIELLEVDQDKPMSLASINGTLDMSLPVGFNGTLKVDSDSNEIYSDFEIEVLPTEPTIKRNNGKGRFKISLTNEIHGRIGTGNGPEIHIKTLNGDVRINKTKS